MHTVNLSQISNTVFFSMMIITALMIYNDTISCLAFYRTMLLVETTDIFGIQNNPQVRGLIFPLE